MTSRCQDSAGTRATSHLPRCTPALWQDTRHGVQPHEHSKRDHTHGRDMGSVSPSKTAGVRAADHTNTHAPPR